MTSHTTSLEISRRRKKTAKFKGECWNWPYAVSKDGYGLLSINKKTLSAYKWLFEELRGRVLEKMELDHLCRNRLCVNPEHLEPVTHKENCLRGSNTKLTAEDVREIRKLKGTMTQRKIGEQFGVTHTTIGYIFSGKRWVA